MKKPLIKLVFRINYFLGLFIVLYLGFLILKINIAQANDTFIFNNNLSLNSYSKDVKELQKFLNNNVFQFQRMVQAH